MANLIAYCSRKGENYWADSVKNLEKGNTERVAEAIDGGATASCYHGLL